MLLQYSSKLLQPTQRLAVPTRSPGICCGVSRRELAIFTNSTALLLSASQALLHVRGSGISKAEEAEQQQQQLQLVEEENSDAAGAASSCIDSSSSSPATKRAFLDISIEGQPAGRIVVGVYEGGPAPLGASRFIDLVSGRAGVSYRRKEFVKIMPGYVQHAGVRSYGVDAELLQAATPLQDALEREWARSNEGRCPRPLNSQGSLSILVRNPSKPPPKTKLVARGGKLQMDQEEVGADPNATEFLICTEDSPQLDDSALVIGRVLQGMDVVRRIAQVKTVQDNTTSPYFRVAKLIGDKRAVVAERGFNRPYSKVLVTNCGLLD